MMKTNTFYFAKTSSTTFNRVLHQNSFEGKSPDPHSPALYLWKMAILARAVSPHTQFGLPAGVNIISVHVVTVSWLSHSFKECRLITLLASNLVEIGDRGHGQKFTEVI